MNKGPVKVAIVGAGNRAMIYAKHALFYPDEMEIVAVVDPSVVRRERAMKTFGLTKSQCYESVEEFAKQPKMADAVINGTMDHLHIETSIPLLEKGYDLLLEKPFAVNKEEVYQLQDVVEKNNSKVMICHVLRYTPFYSEIKERLLNNEIGDIINIQTTEHVSFHHMAVSYVRGKWRSKELCHASMLLAKSCHDLDIIMWLNNATAPKSIASFGNNMQFTKDKMPENAGHRCMVDCPIEADCNYSAKKHYIDHPDRWVQYVWTDLEGIENPTIEQKIQSLKTDNHYGKCVWRYDNDVVDHQSVVIEFENGCTATHNMIGGAAKSQRYLHIIGTKGEIRGVFEDSQYTVRIIKPGKNQDYIEEEIKLEESGDMVGAFGDHGGGDALLIADFIKYIKGEDTSISRTTLNDSINSHLAVFYADEAMEERKVVDFKA